MRTRPGANSVIVTGSLLQNQIAVAVVLPVETDAHTMRARLPDDGVGEMKPAFQVVRRDGVANHQTGLCNGDRRLVQARGTADNPPHERRHCCELTTKAESRRSLTSVGRSTLVNATRP